nr:hypothetical protein [Tanacetum cinerariifolium]
MGKGVDSSGMAAGSRRMEVTGWREIRRMNRGLNVGCDREGVWEFYNISPCSLICRYWSLEFVFLLFSAFSTVTDF